VLRRRRFSPRALFGGIGRKLAGSSKKTPPPSVEPEAGVKEELEPVKGDTEEATDKTAPRKRRTARTSTRRMKEGDTE